MGLQEGSKPGDEASASELANRAIDNAAGRKNGQQEAVPDPKELKKALPDLIELFERAERAKEALSKKVKAVAKECGFNADVVRCIMKAKAGEKEDLFVEKRRAQQLVLAFEVIAPEPKEKDKKK